MRVRVDGERVHLGGQAVTVLRGELLLLSEFSEWMQSRPSMILDLRVGRMDLRAEPNERARKPSYKLWIDFGPLGEKTSSAQLSAHYRPKELVGRLVIAAVNLGARNIAGFARRCWCWACPSERARRCCWRWTEVPLGGGSIDAAFYSLH